MMMAFMRRVTQQFEGRLPLDQAVYNGLSEYFSSFAYDGNAYENTSNGSF